MTIDEMMNRMRESLRATMVYAEPVEKDGLTVIPAAVVYGGGGGGKGERAGEHGEGGGFGLVARPAGAFVIENGDVRWLPAMDAARLISAGVLVALALTRRWRRRHRLTSARPRG
jgi:uncharacterized spore protein YtfJ